MLTFWNNDFSLLIRTLTSFFQTQLTLNWWFTLFLIEKREGISCHHFMASRRGKSGSSDRFYLLGLQNTVDGNCSHEIKRCLLLGRKAMTNLDSVLKSRDIILPINFHIVKDMVLPLVMYGCEIWTIKKAEHQRIYAFELWCWRSLLRVPWMAGIQTSHSYRKSTLNILWKDWCWSWSSNTLATEGDNRAWDG